MTSKTMKAAVFVEPGRIELREKPIPEIGPDDALVRVTTTTICGTDIHIRKGEYAVRPGLTIGHEPVGMRLHPVERGRFDKLWPPLFRHGDSEPFGETTDFTVEVRQQVVEVDKHHIRLLPATPRVRQVPKDAGQRVEALSGIGIPLDP